MPARKLTRKHSKQTDFAHKVRTDAKKKFSSLMIVQSIVSAGYRIVTPLQHPHLNRSDLPASDCNVAPEATSLPTTSLVRRRTVQLTSFKFAIHHSHS